MRTMKLGRSGMEVPVIAVGCMRINTISKTEADAFVKTALDLGAVFFDHADIYGSGSSEEIFAAAAGMNSAVREKIFLQSKCGIRIGKAFDFSKEHILKSVDGSLQRLKTDYLDVLLLHRPDMLCEPEEVAEAFGILHSRGKVRSFGVSNQNPGQIQLLEKFVGQPFVANQLQLSITHASMVGKGIYVNMANEGAVDRDGGILDFCRLRDITIQPWSPFQVGFMKGVFLGNPEFPELNAVIARLAEKYSVSDVTITMAWLLRHPARFQPVTGTMNRDRLKDCVKAAEITLTRDEWYEIYLSAGNKLP